MAAAAKQSENQAPLPQGGAPGYFLAVTGICIAYPMRMQLYLHDKKEKIGLAAFCLCTEAARC